MAAAVDGSQRLITGPEDWVWLAEQIDWMPKDSADFVTACREVSEVATGAWYSMPVLSLDSLVLTVRAPDGDLQRETIDLDASMLLDRDSIVAHVQPAVSTGTELVTARIWLIGTIIRR